MSLSGGPLFCLPQMGTITTISFKCFCSNCHADHSASHSILKPQISYAVSFHFKGEETKANKLGKSLKITANR